MSTPSQKERLQPIEERLAIYSASGAAICAAREAASSPTPNRIPDLRLYNQGNPRKYKPGYLVTPRFWMGYPFESTTGNFTRLKSKAYPVAHTTVEIPSPCRFSSVISSSL